MLSELADSIDERDMIAKKTEWRERGIKLKTDKSDKTSILTTQGKIHYSRYVLRPTLKEQREDLKRQTGSRSVVPLDDWLGVSRLPFKMSVKAMLEVAFWAQNQCSYQRAEEILKRSGVMVNDTTVREVANYVGNYVFKRDCKQAEETMARHNKCEIPFAREREGVLYIKTDGAALNARQRDESGST